MYTIGDLADELNRQEWAVERMLKNRGYLKQNGEPRKSTIDDGLMNKNGLITKLGWSTFIDELGYKETDEDEEDDDDIIDEEVDSDDDDGDWDYDSDDKEDDGNDWNEEEAYPDDYVNNRGDNYEYIRENVTIDDNGSGEEVAVCPECKDIMTERDAEEQHGDIFNFECHCGHSFSAELHNVICETCERLVSVHRVIKYESFNFCCENCKSLFLDPPDDDSGITPFSDGVSNCTYCNKSGICKNGDNPYYFDQGCPGECSFYYRK